jgi:FkbM family methyltransferase
MKHALPLSLLAKSAAVGTLFEGPLHQLRWRLGSLSRNRHPELWEIYLEQQRLPLVLCRLLQTDSSAVDIGCHIGSFLSLLQRFAPKGQHIAYEPSSQKSRWLNKRFPDVQIVNAAVGVRNGRARFIEDLSQPALSHLWRDSKTAGPNCATYDVALCCLDEALAKMNRIDLIKIDVEGAELDVLEGARGVIRKHRPAIIFECGPDKTLAEQGSSRENLHHLIRTELGYKVFCFGDYLYDKGDLSFSEFRKCGLYPFRAFNFIALPENAT